MPTAYENLTSMQRLLCLFVGLATVGVGIALQIQLWDLDAQGLSIKGERLPYWDFSNLWAGSVLAVEGKTALLFDPAAYRAALDDIFGVRLQHPQEWSYPPSILLIGAPLAMMPIWLAFIVWSLGTVFLLHLAIRPFGLPVLVHLFVVFSPAIWFNQVFGQNGALTAAVLIAGLYHAPRRPVLAGMLIGLLTIKPHLGFLIPFCLLASRNWTAFVSAAVTSIGLAALTALLFGWDVWTQFLSETRPLMTMILEAPYPQAYHTHAATVFILMRSLGAGLEVAYLGQALIAGAAAIAVVVLWWPSSRLDHRSRVALTCMLAIVATPYGYTHDTAPLYLAIAWFLLRDPAPIFPLYAAAWVFAMLFPALHDVGIAGGIIGPLALAIYLWWRFALPVAGLPVGPVTDGSPVK